jgi:hypothetical protein
MFGKSPAFFRFSRIIPFKRRENLCHLSANDASGGNPFPKPQAMSSMSVQTETSSTPRISCGRPLRVSSLNPSAESPKSPFRMIGLSFQRNPPHTMWGLLPRMTWGTKATLFYPRGSSDSFPHRLLQKAGSTAFSREVPPGGCDSLSKGDLAFPQSTCRGIPEPIQR